MALSPMSFQKRLQRLGFSGKYDLMPAQRNVERLAPLVKLMYSLDLDAKPTWHQLLIEMGIRANLNLHSSFTCPWPPDYLSGSFGNYSLPWAYRTWRIVRGMNQPLGASSMRFTMSSKNADSLAQLGCATPHQACEALKYSVLQVGGQEETAHAFDLASICNCF